MTNAACACINELRALLAGSLPEVEQERLALHLGNCAACRTRLESLAGSVTPLPSPSDPATTPRSQALEQAMARLKGHTSSLGQTPLRPPDEPGVVPGRLGDYELLGELGRGGMGVVYRARQISLNRPVALKLILAGKVATPVEVERFRVEAEAAARLDHPHIVPIYEIGEHEGRHFFSMKLIEEGRLTEHPAEFRVPSPELARTQSSAEFGARIAKLAGFVATLARAVHYAHQRGVLHRDLKPGNVLLDAQGQPHLTDFGLAKLLESDLGLTHSGAVMGTPDYFAPEVAAGKARELTTAADIYSLGAILYELLTDRPPFHEETMAATMQKVLHTEPPAPRSLNTAIPRDLETIALKCLEKEPERRYPTAEMLAQELDRCQRGEPILARPAGAPEKFWRWCRRKPALAASLAALCFVGVAGFAGVFWQWRRAEDRAAELSIERQRAQAIAQAERQQRERAEFDRAELLLNQQRIELPLAYLARLLRHNPSNAVVAARVQSVLSARGFCLPALPPLEHRRPIHTARYSPKGLHILTAARELEARIWDARSGQVKHSLPHDEAVQAAAFSPDSALVATGADDGTARLWRVADGQPMVTLKHDGPVHLLQFSPDGRTLLTASDRAIHLWDVASGELVLSPGVRHRNRIAGINFSPDGRHFVSVGQGAGRQERAAIVWNAATGEQIGENILDFGRPPHAAFTPDGEHLLLAHARTYHWPSGQWRTNRSDLSEFWHFASAFSPDGRRVLLGTGGSGARLLDVETFQPLLPPLRHEQPISYVGFSPDGGVLLTAGNDGVVALWDARTGQPRAAPIRHHEPVVFAEFSPDGTRLLTLPEGRAAHVWDVRVDQPMSRRFLHGDAVTALRFSKDSTKVLSASRDGTARLWAAATGRELLPPLRHSNAVNAVAFSPDERLIATASSDLSANVWSASTGQRVAGPLRHQKIARTAEFDATGGRLVTAADDGTARIWNPTNGVELRVLAHDAPRVNSAHFSADGAHVLTASNDRRVRLWEALTGRAVLTLRHQGAVAGAVFTPEGRRIVTVGSDRAVRVWDRTTGSALGRPIEHPAGVHPDSPQFHPDGGRILTASGYSAYVWHLDDGTAAAPPVAHEDLIASALFRPDGRLMATASRDRTARLWDTATGLPVSERLPHLERVECAAFSPDGRWLATGAADGSVQFWEVPELPARVPAWLPNLVEAVTRQRLNEQNHIEPVPPDAMAEVKEAIAKEPSNEELVRWAKWFLADTATRAIAPSSEITLPEYVRCRTEENMLESLEEAVRLSSTNAVAFARLASRLVALSSARSNARQDAEWFSRYATNLAPDNPEVRHIRQSVVEQIRRKEGNPRVPAAP